MAKTADDVIREALELPEEGRGRVLAALVKALDGPPCSSDDAEAWEAELRRRVEDARAGTDDAVSCEDALDELESELRAARARRKTA